MTDKNKRIFYDKFDKTFENQDFDVKEFKEIYGIFLKKSFYHIISKAIGWILISAVVCSLVQTYEIFQHALKVSILYHFILVYYLYS